MDFNVGHVVTFKYGGGSNPGNIRVVRVTEKEGNRFKGIDLTKDHENNFRNFNELMVSELQVVADTSSKVVSVFDKKFLLSKFDIPFNSKTANLSDVCWDVLAQALDEDAYLWVNNEYLLKIKDKKSTVEVDGESTLMVDNGKGRVLTIGVDDHGLNVILSNKDDEEEVFVGVPVNNFAEVRPALSLISRFLND